MTDSQDQAFTTADFLEDFDYLWEAFAAEYAYFDEKDTDWGQVRQHYRKEIESTSEAGAFISILERTLEELYDNHIHLTYNTPHHHASFPPDQTCMPNGVRKGRRFWRYARGFRQLLVVSGRETLYSRLTMLPLPKP